MQHGYDKDALKKRIHRIEGHVCGIERMVDEDRYCIDILTQVAAVRTALESLSFEVLEDHVEPLRPRRPCGRRRGGRDDEEQGAFGGRRALRQDEVSRGEGRRRPRLARRASNIWREVVQPSKLLRVGVTYPYSSSGDEKYKGARTAGRPITARLRPRIA